MSDHLFREVDDAVRQDQLKALWDRYGIYVIAGAVLIIATVGGIKGWQYWQVQRAADSGTRFEGALALVQEGKTAEAENALRDLADGGPAGYRALAQLRLAAAKVSSGALAEAVADYDALAENAALDSGLRDLARIRAASLRIDSADLAEMTTRVGALADGTGPWRHSARELLGLAAFRAGNMADAERHFMAVAADTAAPPRLRQRVEMMLALISKPADGTAAVPKS